MHENILTIIKNLKVGENFFFENGANYYKVSTFLKCPSLPNLIRGVLFAG